MADYDQTIGVKLDDDFSSLQKSLTALNRKMQLNFFVTRKNHHLT